MSTAAIINAIAWDAAAEFAEQPLAEPSSFGHLDFPDCEFSHDDAADFDNWLASLDVELPDAPEPIAFDFDAEFDVDSDLFDLA